MFRDEFEAMDPAKLPFESYEAATDEAVDDPYGDGLDPEERVLQKYPTPTPLL